jgi:hypothetical protein
MMTRRVAVAAAGGTSAPSSRSFVAQMSAWRRSLRGDALEGRAAARVALDRASAS